MTYFIINKGKKRITYPLKYCKRCDGSDIYRDTSKCAILAHFTETN